jgi:xanthine/CO dehydrogenase XdhC/CoxF family maturation factor
MDWMARNTSPMGVAAQDRAQRCRLRSSPEFRFFSSYGGRFLVRFAPMGPQQREELVYANLSRRRVAARSGNGKAARLAPSAMAAGKP